jgi:hypothetical protein
MAASAYSGPDGFLALLGEMDWRVERDLLIKDRKKNVVERESAA